MNTTSEKLQLSEEIKQQFDRLDYPLSMRGFIAMFIYDPAFKDRVRPLSATTNTADLPLLEAMSQPEIFAMAVHTLAVMKSAQDWQHFERIMGAVREKDIQPELKQSDGFDRLLDGFVASAKPLNISKNQDPTSNS